MGKTIPVTNWYVKEPMDGNDRAGDCAEAAFVHADMAWRKDLNATPCTLDAVHLYSAITGYDPSQTDSNDNNPTDQGTDPAQLLDWLVQNGYVAAWAEVDDPSLVIPALYSFDGLLAAAALPDSADDQFTAGGPWDVPPGYSGPVNADHMIYVPGYNPWQVVTWGREINMTPAWASGCIRQWFALFSQDQLTPAGLDEIGLDSTTLLADIQALARVTSPSLSNPAVRHLNRPRWGNHRRNRGPIAPQA